MCCAHMFYRDLTLFLTYRASHSFSSSWRKVLTLMPPCKRFLIMGDVIPLGVRWSYALQIYGNVSLLASSQGTEKTMTDGVISSHSCVSKMCLVF